VKIIALLHTCLSISFSFAQLPGDLDLSFGTNGINYAGVPTYEHFIRDMAIQDDDKIVVVGFTLSNYYLISRFNADGSTDNSFGDNGEIFFEFPINDYAHARTVGIQSNNKIIVGGGSGLITDQKFTLVRFDSNGVLDETFGQDGLVYTYINNLSDGANDLVIQPDDKIILAGVSNHSNYGHTAIARYSNDGELDLTFADQGILDLDIGFGSSCQSVKLQSDTKVVALLNVSEVGDSKIGVLRLNSDGSPDTDFGTDGIVITNLSLDSDYYETATSLALQADGKIVIGGYIGNGSQQEDDDFYLIRYTANGILDNTFGNDGVVFTDVNAASNDRLQDILVQSDGKIMATGTFRSGSEYDFALVRYNADGELDALFGDQGVALSDLYDGYGYSLGVQSDKKIILGGFVSFPDNSTSFSVARYFSGLELGLLDFGNDRGAFIAYPNPIDTKTTMTYTLNQAETLTVKLFDLSGRLIKVIENGAFKEVGNHTETIDFTGIATGNYAISITNALGSSISLQIIKKLKKSSYRALF
jgi:uncharacterized delta-60 repeat protein